MAPPMAAAAPAPGGLGEADTARVMEALRAQPAPTVDAKEVESLVLLRRRRGLGRLDMGPFALIYGAITLGLLLNAIAGNWCGGGARAAARRGARRCMLLRDPRRTRPVQPAPAHLTPARAPAPGAPSRSPPTRSAPPRCSTCSRCCSPCGAWTGRRSRRARASRAWRTQSWSRWGRGRGGGVPAACSRSEEARAARGARAGGATRPPPLLRSRR